MRLDLKPVILMRDWACFEFIQKEWSPTTDKSLKVKREGTNGYRELGDVDGNKSQSKSQNTPITRFFMH